MSADNDRPTPGTKPAFLAPLAEHLRPTQPIEPRYASTIFVRVLIKEGSVVVLDRSDSVTEGAE